jgi:tetraacyldisaccharide 4'-kinase
MKPLTAIVLPPLSLIYNISIRARLALFETGVLPVSRLDVPVISIGNITTGGTGKTPLVEWICRLLAGAGNKVCILTRGYGRLKSNARVVVSDGTQILADHLHAGDEPFLLAQRLLGFAAVISDSDRYAAGQWARKEFGTEVFLLDDGFQHLQLSRALNIVTIDATNPWGGGSLLPYGRLREPRSGLKRADCVVITRADQAEELSPLISEIKSFVNDRPIVISSMRFVGFENLSGISENETDSDIASPVAAFCGIGNPCAFFSQLKVLGYELKMERIFPDHHIYDRKDIDSIVAEGKSVGVKMLLTTAKDAVKLRSFEFEIPTMVVRIEPVFEDDSALRSLILKEMGT